jgi:diaminohydroxyphosphoribosylaminopyrimidine deaminase/5-amino-6-(5-phosphoribosylamino)uracil reductase
VIEDCNVSEVLATKNLAVQQRAVQRLRQPHYSDIFLPILNASADQPFVVAQLGQSLDGRIATVTGESRWINGESTLEHLHRLRAHVDAVVVGVGTAQADNPLLTVRRVDGPSPARVVLDLGGRLSTNARCLADDGTERLVFGPARAGLPRGVDCIDLGNGESRLCPRAIANALFQRGLKRILIEGGAWTVSRFIEARAIDRLHMLVAPVILGSGKNGIDLTPIESLDDALRPPAAAYVRDDGEVIFDCDLRGMQNGTGKPNG